MNTKSPGGRFHRDDLSPLEIKRLQPPPEANFPARGGEFTLAWVAPCAEIAPERRACNRCGRTILAGARANLDTIPRPSERDDRRLHDLSRLGLRLRCCGAGRLRGAKAPPAAHPRLCTWWNPHRSIHTRPHRLRNTRPRTFCRDRSDLAHVLDRLRVLVPRPPAGEVGCPGRRAPRD